MKGDYGGGSINDASQPIDVSINVVNQTNVGYIYAYNM